MPPQPAADRLAIPVNSGLGGGIGRDVRLRAQSGDRADHGDASGLAGDQPGQHRLYCMQHAHQVDLNLFAGDARRLWLTLAAARGDACICDDDGDRGGVIEGFDGGFHRRLIRHVDGRDLNLGALRAGGLGDLGQPFGVSRDQQQGCARRGVFLRQRRPYPA